MANKDFPYVPKELIEALEGLFKDTIPIGLEHDLDDFRVRQGQQTVVRFLRKQYEKQTREILES